MSPNADSPVHSAKKKFFFLYGCWDTQMFCEKL